MLSQIRDIKLQIIYTICERVKINLTIAEIDLQDGTFIEPCDDEQRRYMNAMLKL